MTARPHAYCYIAECSDGSYYTGWSSNPLQRIKDHNAGRGARYTRSRRPVRLVFVEPQRTRSNAMRRERAIKTLRRAAKRRLIEDSSPNTMQSLLSAQQAKDQKTPG